MQQLKWIVAAMIVVMSGAAAQNAQASLTLGTGAGALKTSDLTDPENDGDSQNNVNYNVVSFFADQEASFGGGEAAFNVFDNQVGGGDDKWCCGNTPGGFPHFVGFQLAAPKQLTHFTITGGNDSPERDPRIWSIEGSNDGTNWTSIFTQNNAAASIWTAGGDVRNQVILFDAGNFAGMGAQNDFALPAAYTFFRFFTSATGAVGGADFQLNELEFFGRNLPIPEPASMSLLGLAAAGMLLRRRRLA